MRRRCTCSGLGKPSSLGCWCAARRRAIGAGCKAATTVRGILRCGCSASRRPTAGRTSSAAWLASCRPGRPAPIDQSLTPGRAASSTCGLTQPVVSFAVTCRAGSHEHSRRSHSSRLAHHQAGRLREASRFICKSCSPNRKTQALHLLPELVAFQSQDHSRAEQLISRAIRLDGGQASFHVNSGRGLPAMGRMDMARLALCAGRATQSGLAQAQNNLGTILQSERKVAEAVACYRKAIEAQPDYADAHNNLGTALQDQGEFESAVAAYRRTVEVVAPATSRHTTTSGCALSCCAARRGPQALETAIAVQETYAEAHLRCRAPSCRTKGMDRRQPLAATLQLRPNLVEAWTGLGMLSNHRETSTRRSRITRKPCSCAATTPKGTTTGRRGGRLRRPDEAAAKYRQAIACRPNFTEAWFNLGRVLQDLGTGGGGGRRGLSRGRAIAPVVCHRAQ